MIDKKVEVSVFLKCARFFGFQIKPVEALQDSLAVLTFKSTVFNDKQAVFGKLFLQQKQEFDYEDLTLLTTPLQPKGTFARRRAAAIGTGLTVLAGAGLAAKYLWPRQSSKS